jgi:hypothetical protein
MNRREAASHNVPIVLEIGRVKALISCRWKALTNPKRWITPWIKANMTTAIFTGVSVK